MQFEVCVTVPPHAASGGDASEATAPALGRQFCGGPSPPPGEHHASLLGECHGLAPPILAAATTASTNWTYYAGALVAGDDVGSDNLTLADAEAKCVGISGCIGFTFEASASNPLPSKSSCVANKCHVYFKSKVNLNTDSSWGTWLIHPMTHPPNPHRTDPACYSAHMFGDEAVRRISAHVEESGADSPFMLYLAMQDVHEPVSAPASFIAMHTDIADSTRRTYAAMVSAMDEAIGNVTDAMKAAKMWDNSVFVISNDNGVRTQAPRTPT